MQHMDRSQSPYLIALAKLERHKVWYRGWQRARRVLLIVVVPSAFAVVGLVYLGRLGLQSPWAVGVIQSPFGAAEMTRAPIPPADADADSGEGGQ